MKTIEIEAENGRPNFNLSRINRIFVAFTAPFKSDQTNRLRHVKGTPPIVDRNVRLLVMEYRSNCENISGISSLARGQISKNKPDDVIIVSFSYA